MLTPKQKKKTKKMEATKLMPATLTDPLNRKLEGESSVKYKYVVYEYYVFFKKNMYFFILPVLYICAGVDLIQNNIY